jgi:RNA polymerase sigma factor (sigma-70 family)
MKLVDLQTLKTFSKRYFADESFYKNGANLQIMKEMPEFNEYVKNKEAITDKRKGVLEACSAEPVLSKTQQLHLFKHYNFLKYCIAKKLINKKFTPKLHLQMSDFYWRAKKIGNLLATSNFKLIGCVKKQLTTYSQCKFTREEFVGEVYSSILKAVDLFDWTRGFCFSTYATWAVKNNLIKVQQQHYKALTKHQSLTKLRIDKDFDPPSDYSTVSEVSTKEKKTISEDLLGLLHPVLESRERFILMRMFGFTKTLPEENTLSAVGKELNISKERVRQIKLRALEYIKKRTIAQERTNNVC